MKRILAMSVGTGIGENIEAKVKNLAHGLLHAIEHYRPDQIIFFGSEKSEQTVNELKSQYHEKHGNVSLSYEFHLLDSIDDLDKCLQSMKKILLPFRNEELIIDYTSGTKTMTTSAAMISVMFKTKLTLISGNRGKNGLVQLNTEKIQEQNLYHVFDELEIMKMKELINTYQFPAALKILENLRSLDSPKYQCYENLIKGLNAWDQFKHKEAKEFFDKIPEKFGNLKGHLGKIVKLSCCDADNAKLSLNKTILIDLLNNALRRIEEAKLDDAVARMYRIMEMIAQFQLELRYSILSNNIDVNILREKKISEDFIEEITKSNSINGVIKIGLAKDYALLAELHDPIGMSYVKDANIQNFMKKRNNSILAHGLYPIENSDAEKLFSLVVDFADLFINYDNLKDKKRHNVDIQTLMNVCKFPSL